MTFPCIGSSPSPMIFQEDPMDIGAPGDQVPQVPMVPQGFRGAFVLLGVVQKAGRMVQQKPGPWRISVRSLGVIELSN